MSGEGKLTNTSNRKEHGMDYESIAQELEAMAESVDGTTPIDRFDVHHLAGKCEGLRVAAQKMRDAAAKHTESQSVVRNERERELMIAALQQLADKMHRQDMNQTACEVSNMAARLSAAKNTESKSVSRDAALLRSKIETEVGDGGNLVGMSVGMARRILATLESQSRGFTATECKSDPQVVGWAMEHPDGRVDVHSLGERDMADADADCYDGRVVPLVRATECRSVPLGALHDLVREMDSVAQAAESAAEHCNGSMHAEYEAKAEQAHRWAATLDELIKKHTDCGSVAGTEGE